MRAQECCAPLADSSSLLVFIQQNQTQEDDNDVTQKLIHNAFQNISEHVRQHNSVRVFT